MLLKTDDGYAAVVAACHCCIASARKRRSARREIRWCRTLNVERVVDGGMHGEEAQSVHKLSTWNMTDTQPRPGFLCRSGHILKPELIEGAGLEDIAKGLANG